jgi:hypothetical protein
VISIPLWDKRKRGGNIVRVPLRDWMKELIFFGDLVDIKPIRGHST